MRFLLFTAILLLIFLAYAGLSSAVSTDEVHSISLLSVTQLDDETYRGGVATLYLQVKPGQGSIFVESYPLAKIDTQVAIRFANEVACEYSEVDCSNYNFFYTIRADSPIVGGPSGGGATALLTLSVLEDIKLKDNFAMTGSISSGGIIGSVAGIKEKVEAAGKNGKEFVIIPELALEKNPIFNASSNSTPLTKESLENYSVKVVPVITLEEALEASAVSYKPKIFTDIIVDDAYTQRMGLTSKHLCDQSEKLLSQIGESNSSLYVIAESFYNKSQAINDSKNYYSKASFCYSANLRLRELLLENISQEVLEENYERLLDAHENFNRELEKIDINTFTDLETKVIVTERLLESKNFLDEINKSNISSSLLAYAIERYESAIAWSGFFGLPGEPLMLDDTTVKMACLQELQNVESRMNYLRSLLPDSYLESVNDELTKAYEYQQNEKFALCLFKSTKAKAHANIFFSTFGMVTNTTKEIAQAKLDRAEIVIASQENAFPILGYSYYVYAQELLPEDDYSALLFAEYALGMSDISKYFPPKESFTFSRETLLYFGVFVVGFLLGGFFVFVIKRKIPEKTTTSSSLPGKKR